MASLTSDQLKADLKDILKGADLSKLSSKKVRKQLEDKYGTDLTERKKEIDVLLMAVVEEQENQPDDSSSESDHLSDMDEPVPLKKKRKTPVKKQVEKAASADDPDDDEPNEIDDELLARQLQDEESSTGRRTRGSANRKTPTKRTPKAKRQKRAKRENSGSGYTKPLLLSPALADFLGAEWLPRNQVVKKLWEVVKERNLLDPKNKNFVRCDDDLYKIFKRRRFRMFGCMKHLTHHMFNSVEELESL